MIPLRSLRPGTITLVTGSKRSTARAMHGLVVEAALRGPVRVLLGGNRFSFYDVAYALAAETGQYEDILRSGITLSRAETCYQLVELLLETPPGSTLTLVSDLLATFYDEGVPEAEIDQLLFESLLQLRRLSRQAPVVVSAHGRDNRPRLLKALENKAGEVICLDPVAQIPAVQHDFIP